MLKTKYFSFDRRGRLTIFTDRISLASIVRILRLCTAHARRKHTVKPSTWIIIPTLEAV